MNQEIKTKWLADLRSGEFEKGKGYLKRDGKFCCLGVLCDQAEKAGIVTTREGRDGSVYFQSVTNEFDASASVLPQAVVHWAELHLALGSTNPAVRVVTEDGEGKVCSLSSINDNDNEDEPQGEFTFLQIAEMIERDL